MSGLDLDSLRGRWAEQGRAIDAGVRVDVAAMKAALQRRQASTRRRQLAAVAATLATDVALLLALLAYVIARAGQPAWQLMALGLAAPLLAHAVGGFRQWRLLRALDLGGPVPAALDTMQALRALRLRLARMIVLLSVLLWWPLLLVLANALSGADLLRWLHWSVLWGNVVAGVVFVPLGWALMRWLARRFGDRPGLRGFLDETAGRGWQRLRDGLVAGERLDAGDDSLLASPPLPAAAHAALAALRARLWAVIAAAALALLAVGAFNALHGGLVQFIAPGVLLNLAVVAQLAFSIENRRALARAGDDAAALRQVLPLVAGQREALARGTLAAAPLWLPALAQVLVATLAGGDLVAGLGGTGQALLAAVVLAASAGLGVLAWRQPARFPPALVAAVACGVPAAARRALARLVADAG